MPPYFLVEIVDCDSFAWIEVLGPGRAGTDRHYKLFGQTRGPQATFTDFRR